MEAVNCGLMVMRNTLHHQGQFIVTAQEKLNTISFNMKFKIKVLRDLQNKKKFKIKVLLVGVTAVTFKRRGHQKELKH